MTLKLPEPLPYDYVDELLDEQFRFYNETYHSYHAPDGTQYENKVEWKRPRCTDQNFCTTDYPRQMFEVMPDVDEPYYKESPEEGYVTMHALVGWSWTAKPWTESMINAFLGIHRE